MHKTESLVATITTAYFGEEIYKTQQEKALAYLYFLIKDHPFVDGNKRTACLVFEVICEINNLETDYSVFKLDEIAIFIEKINEPNHHQVIALLSGVMFKD
jgi:prophage maintenance system killer protein